MIYFIYIVFNMGNHIITNSNYGNINNPRFIVQLKIKYIITAVSAILVGLSIYAFFRNHNMLIFNFFSKPSFLESIYISIADDNFFISILLYNLPDGLWFLSGILIIRAVWLANEKCRLIYFCIFLLAALVMEISQISLNIHGTFDFLDIAFMVLFAIAENLIFIKYINRSIL